MKNSKGDNALPSVAICSRNGAYIVSSSGLVNSPGTSPPERSEFTVSRIAEFTSWWSSRYNKVSLLSTPTSARIFFKSTRKDRSSYFNVIFGLTNSIACACATSEHVVRLPTPLFPAKSKCPPGCDSTRLNRATRCKTSGKSKMFSSLISRSYDTSFAATCCSK